MKQCIALKQHSEARVAEVGVSKEERGMKDQIREVAEGKIS